MTVSLYIYINNAKCFQRQNQFYIVTVTDFIERIIIVGLIMSRYNLVPLIIHILVGLSHGCGKQQGLLKVFYNFGHN